MLIKKANMSCVFRWSPMDTQPNMIAAGSIAGAMSDDFNSSATLNIFNFDLFDENKALILEGSVEVYEKMTHLAWATHVDYDLGIVAAGLSDGLVNIYDPAQIVAKTQKSELICSIEAHTSSLKSLEFNPFHPHLLATAGQDQDLKVWSIQRLSEPCLSICPTSSKNPITGEIRCMQWHNKFSHILACCSSSGYAHIFDMKAKRCTSAFTNAKQRDAFTCLSWNPDQATQLAVAVDSNDPKIQIWDLRRAVAPIRSFSAHTDTILSFSWGKKDSNMLLSSSADGNFFCWNPNSGELIAEFEKSSNWVTDIQWSNTNQTLFATSGYDNSLNVFSMNGTSDISRSMLHTTWKTAPRWLQRPCIIAHKSDGSLFVVNNKIHSAPIASVLTTVSSENTCLGKSEWGRAIEEFSAGRTISSVTEKAESINVCWASLESITGSIDKSTFAQLVTISLSLETGGDIKSIGNILRSRSKEVQGCNYPKDAVSATNFVNLAVLNGNIDEAIQISTENGQFDDAFMMLPFASTSIQDRVYSEYVQRKPSAFFIRALNGVRTDSILEVIEAEKSAPWSQVLLYALNFCEEHKFMTALMIISKRLTEKLTTKSANELQENTFGLLLTALLRHDSKMIFDMVFIDTVCNFDETECMQTVQKNLDDSLLFEKYIQDVPSHKLLEITGKILALCAFFESDSMPDEFFILISHVCRLLIAEGSKSLSVVILTSLFLNLSFRYSYSPVKNECMIVFDQILISMGLEYKSIWYEQALFNNFTPKKLNSEHVASLSSTNIVSVHSEVQSDSTAFEPVDQKNSFRVCEKDISSTNQTIDSLRPASYVDGQFSSLRLEESTEILPNLNAHISLQESSKVNQHIYTKQSEETKTACDMKTQHDVHCNQEAHPSVHGNSETAIKSNNSYQHKIQAYQSPFVVKENTVSSSSKEQIDSRMPLKCSDVMQGASSCKDTLQWASRYPSALCDTLEKTSSSLQANDTSSVKNDQKSNLKTLKSSQSTYGEAYSSEIAQTSSGILQDQYSTSCLSMALVNVKPGSLENEVINNFKSLFNAVSDKRKKECIGKALFTLFQEIDRGGIERELIEILHRFTLSAQTIEGKELIRTMGTCHWSSFRKFMNIKFL